MSVPMTAAGVTPGQTLRFVLPPLLLGLVLLAALFWQEIDAAVSVWSSSTAYNHCFLVLPIAGWLAWERRDLLPGLPIRPLPWAALLALPLALLWFASERLGIMEGRQLAALGFVEVLILTLVGWPIVRAMGAPLIYLVFLVPFGAFLTGSLQDFTAHFVVTGLDLLGITNFSDGYTIEIPEGVFYVAEACAGLRFLIAAVAFGVLYAIMLYRSPARRLLFVAVSVVVPVIANGIRALGIVVAGHLIGNAEAAAADHLIYGWLFFSVVILLLILAGLPFRQDGVAAARRVAVNPPTNAPAVGLRPAMQMAGLAVLMAVLAGSGPLVAGRLDHAAAAQMASAPVSLPGCEIADAAPVEPALQAVLAGEGAAAQGFYCQGRTLRLVAIAFPPRTNPTRFLAVQRRLTQPIGADDVASAPMSLDSAPGWMEISIRTPPHISATALWIDGAAVGGGLRSRLLQARRSFTGASTPIVLAVAEATAELTLVQGLNRANAESGLSRHLAGLSAGVK